MTKTNFSVLQLFTLFVICGGFRLPAGAQSAAPNTRPFVATIRALLQNPALYLSSTTPNEPLLTAGNTLEALYPCTQDTVAAMEKLIAESDHEILLQIYEYDDTDEAAARVFAALQARVRRAHSNHEKLHVGVVVGRAWPSEHALQQRDVHALVEELQAVGADPDQITLVLSSYRGTPLAILHSKTLTVDGQKSLVMTGNLITHGGIAVDSLNMAAQLRGPVVQTLRADWAQAYALSTQDAAFGRSFTSLGQNASQSVSAMDVGQGQGLHAVVLSRRSRWAPWPDPAPSLQSDGIAALLGAAQQDIRIINPSIGAFAVQQALIDAIVHRHVHVTAILSRHMNANREHWLFGGDNTEQAYKLYLALLQQGGPEAASRLTVLWGSEDGVTPAATRSAGNIHAKVMAIDDDCLLIGSTNFNWLSFNTSRELSVALLGHRVTAAFRDDVWPKIYRTAVPLSAADLAACRRALHLDLVCLHLQQSAQ